MALDLKRLFESEGEQLPFESSPDFSGREKWLPEPVRVKGFVRNTAGVVTVECRIHYTVEAPCDRCLEPVKLEREIACERTAFRALSGEDNDELLVLPDAVLDLDSLVYAEVVLDMPGKILCAEDCRGLCPDCGCNLNREPCRCEKHVRDPRLRPLEQLL